MGLNDKKTQSGWSLVKRSHTVFSVNSNMSCVRVPSFKLQMWVFQVVEAAMCEVSREARVVKLWWSLDRMT